MDLYVLKARQGRIGHLLRGDGPSDPTDLQVHRAGQGEITHVLWEMDLLVKTALRGGSSDQLISRPFAAEREADNLH